MSLLTIEDPEIKNRYFFEIRKLFKIPICKNCKKFFNLGFPKTEKSLCDYLICVQNDLICICDNSKKIEKLYTSDGDASIDIESYYTK